MRLIIVLLAVLTTGGCAAPARTITVSPARLLADHFLEAAFGREYAPTATILHKWTTPVRVRIDGDLPPPVLEALDHDLAVLAGATGLPIRRVRFGAAEMMVHVRPGSDLPEFMAARLAGRTTPHAFRANSCSSAAAATRGTIRQVEIFMKAEQSHSDLTACLVEEVAQGMGLFNDLADAPWSIFSDSSPVDRLTRYDVMLLRILYHPALAAGSGLDWVAHVVGGLAADQMREASGPEDWALPASPD